MEIKKAGLIRTCFVFRFYNVENDEKIHFNNGETTHLLRIHITALMSYLKSTEKIEQRITYDKDKLETRLRKLSPMEHLL